MSELATLGLWTDATLVATIVHDARHDTWQLSYAPSWRDRPDSFSLCPSLPISRGVQHEPEYAPGAIKRFLENLLPEGHALDAIAASQHISKNNVFGLIRMIGAETTGAFRFLPPDQRSGGSAEDAPRRITAEELSSRIASQHARPLIEWDGRIRMSVAGFQEKLPIYLHESASRPHELYMFLPDHPLASTHILKPEPTEVDHMVVNEHFCMSLARALGLPAAQISILRVPQAVLSVKRFDRRPAGAQARGIDSECLPSGESLHPVERLHVIDACQAYDFPVSLKYERNFGGGRDVAHIRDGMSLPRLFRIARQHLIAPALGKRTLTQWVLFQLLIGNYDAHGKNFSFYVTPAGLQPAPWYDLVSVAQYPGFSSELAMAIGDAFTLHDISALELAQFAASCDIQPAFLAREAFRLSTLAAQQVQPLLDAMPYEPQERLFAQGIAAFVLRQADWLTQTARLATQVSADLLEPFNPLLDEA